MPTQSPPPGMPGPDTASTTIGHHFIPPPGSRTSPRPSADIEDLSRIDAVWNLLVLLALRHRPLPRALVDKRVGVFQEAAPHPAAAHHRGTSTDLSRCALPLLTAHFRGTGSGRGWATESCEGHAELPAVSLGFVWCVGLCALSTPTREDATVTPKAAVGGANP